MSIAHRTLLDVHPLWPHGHPCGHIFHIWHIAVHIMGAMTLRIVPTILKDSFSLRMVSCVTSLHLVRASWKSLSMSGIHAVLYIYRAKVSMISTVTERIAVTPLLFTAYSLLPQTTI